ncbi:MAG: peptidoglycan DD-metalloendopeptidase family protein [Bacteroidota bacterium]
MLSCFTAAPRLLALLCLVALLIGSPASWAQRPSSLSERIQSQNALRELEDEIEEFSSRIDATRADEQSAMATLQELDAELALREDLISSYRGRLRLLNTRTDSLQRGVTELEAEIESLRESYATRARSAYKRSRLSDLALILSAQSVTQALVRARYLRRFTDDRRRQMDRVRERTAALEAQRVQLDAAKGDVQQLIARERSEQSEIAARKDERTALVAQLTEQRAALEAEIRQREADADELRVRIRELISAERTRASSPGDTRSEAEIARAERLTGSFRDNRGRLPWPALGTLVGRYGQRTNPVTNTVTMAPGIDISTAPGAEVRSVFDGIVARASRMPSFGSYLIVEHGDVKTVYGNLSLVSVAPGDRVRSGQVIGRAGTASTPRGAGVFFALYDGNDEQDPLPWLRSR